MSSGEKVDAKEDEEMNLNNVHYPQPNASPLPSHPPPSPTQTPHKTDEDDNHVHVHVDDAPKDDVPPPPISVPACPPPPPPPVDEAQDKDPPPSQLKEKSPEGPSPHHHTNVQCNPNGLQSHTQHLKHEDNNDKTPSQTNILPPAKRFSPSKNPSPLIQKPQHDEKIQELKPSIKKESPKVKSDEPTLKTPTKSFLFEPSLTDGYESGTEEEQAAFLKDVENFYRDNSLEFKAPKFYKEELNLLKLWRAVIKLGGYEQVTSCKLWRQVGESFRPPKRQLRKRSIGGKSRGSKGSDEAVAFLVDDGATTFDGVTETCTTVSWTFRIFYEKALLEYEKHKMRNGELPFSDGPMAESIRIESQTGGSQSLGSGRARRDAAARAMQGWHSQRLLGNGQVFHPIIKDKNLSSTPKSDKQLKTNGLLKRNRSSPLEHTFHVGHIKTMKPQGDAMVIDIGPPADWVKINVQRTNDCFEIYALVPGLLREEVHVQSDPAGRLIISGQPEQLDNPWGVTPFKKVVSLPSRIDPHQTSAVVTLHGQLFVRVPFEQSDL